MSFTDDPIKDFEKHDAEQEETLKSLPRCISCGELIQQEAAVFWEVGYICDECLEECRREVSNE